MNLSRIFNVFNLTIIFFSLTTLFLGCIENINNENTIKDDKNYNSIRVKSSNSIPFKLSRFVDSISYLELKGVDPKSVIGSINKLEFDDDKIFILDSRVALSIFIFDLSGNFLTKVGQLGKGPGEFQKPTDMWLEKGKKRILIFDTMSRKLLYYDYNGKFLSEKRVTNRGIKVASIIDKNIIIYNNFSFKGIPAVTPQTSRVFYLNKTGEQVNSYFPIEENDMQQDLVTQNFFQNHVNEVLFNYWRENNIYLLKENGPYLRYEIEFESGPVPNDFFTKSMDKQFQYLKDNKMGHGITGFFETQDFLYFRYAFSENVYSVLYSISSKKIESFNNIRINDIDGIKTRYVFPIGVYKESFVFHFWPQSLSDNLKYHSDSNIISKKAQENLERISAKFKNSLNPVLVFQKYNQF